MSITRRQFIKRGAVSVGLVLPRLWLNEVRAQQPIAAGRRLVVIQLEGGNDGLNTVVPYTDPRYYELRPTLAFRDTELKTSRGVSTLITQEFGLHPALGELKGLYDQNKVAIALGIGYPNPNLSHFLSMDIWHTADTSGLSRTGWLGRYADLAFVGSQGVQAAAIGGLDLPKSFNAHRFVVPNILSFDLYSFITDPNYPGDSANQLNAFNNAAGRYPGESLIGAINTSALESVGGAQTVQRSIGGYKSSVQYPSDNPLAVGLKMVAQLISTIPEASVMYVRMGGFDHHSDQIGKTAGRPDKTQGQHALLLKWFSQAVRLFCDDMNEHNMADQVLIMQWSEFGRRPGENASLGTDHGTAAPLFLVGDPVNAGLHGEQPSLTQDDLDGAGNMKSTGDFRQVYAEILDRWLQVDSTLVLGNSYPSLGLLN